MSSALVHKLSHLDYVSGQQLASDFACTRAAISKQIVQLRKRGLLISSRPSQGYKLDYPYQWWSQQRLQALMAECPECKVHVLDEVDSTNRWLSVHADRQTDQGQLAVTDFQQSGRGRRGRTWLSLPGRQLSWSQSWQANAAPQAWLGLTLAIGVEVAEALESLGLVVELKWPNDILLNGAKLAGILVEMEAQHDGPSFVVAGIGLNEKLTTSEQAQLDQPAADLSQLASYDRHQLLADIACRIIKLFKSYPVLGLEPWRQRWLQRFAWHDREVRFEMNSQWLFGTVSGIALDGSLLVQTDTGLVRCHSGEVTLRLS